MKTHTDFQKKEIISHLFDFDPAMIRFFFESEQITQGHLELRERPEILLEECWEFSAEQQILVRSGLDLWSGTGHVFLWELLNGLCRENLSRLILAMQKYLELKSRFHDPCILQE